MISNYKLFNEARKIFPKSKKESEKKNNHVNMIEDILCEYTDDGLFIINRISPDNISDRTFNINIGLTEEIAEPKGLGRYSRTNYPWDDELRFKFNTIKCEIYLEDCRKKVLDRLKRFGYKEYESTLTYSAGMIISVTFSNKLIKK